MNKQKSPVNSPQEISLYQWIGLYLYLAIKIEGATTLKEREAACISNFEKEWDRYSRLECQIYECEGVNEGKKPHQSESESKSNTHLPSIARYNCSSVEKDAEALGNE